MKLFLSTVLLYFVAAAQVIFGQPQPVDNMQFFKDTSVINATLTTNVGRLLAQKSKIGLKFPATFSCTLPDGTPVNDKILIEVRGHFRRDYCYLPPLKLIFDHQDSAVLKPLKSLKLVSACMTSDEYDQYLLEEYLVYKIYNLLTDKSFNVRLLNINYQDSSGKKKTVSGHAFLMEDLKYMAKRNDCKEWTKPRVPTESTDRKQMTLVAIFEYMIGNTDWAVPVDHNTKLIQSKADSTSRPIVVPYDFDYSGLVSTNYSIPDENLGIENVQTRLYRGFPRTMDELNEALDIFKKQKENIYALINNFDPLNARNKKGLTSYLDGFFEMIDNPNKVRFAFIENARTQ